SSPFGSAKRPRVETGLLAHVPEEERSGLEEARLELVERQEQLALARADVSEVDNRIRIAQQNLDAVQQRVEEARRQVRHAREFGAEENLQDAQQRLDDAQAASRLAQSKIDYYENLKTLAEQRVALLERRVALADAELELARAEAVAGLDRPAAGDVDVQPFRDTVEELRYEAQQARLEALAAHERARLSGDLVGRLAEDVPESFRVNAMEPMDEQLTTRLLEENTLEAIPAAPSR